MPKPVKLHRYEQIVDPITLWLMIHRGDPGPDEPKPINQLTAALAIHQLAGAVTDTKSRQELQAAAGKLVGQLASGMVQH
jgi:hypothetical protein